MVDAIGIEVIVGEVRHIRRHLLSAHVKTEAPLHLPEIAVITPLLLLKVGAAGGGIARLLRAADFKLFKRPVAIAVLTRLNAHTTGWAVDARWLRGGGNQVSRAIAGVAGELNLAVVEYVIAIVIKPGLNAHAACGAGRTSSLKGLLRDVRHLLQHPVPRQRLAIYHPLRRGQPVSK